MSDHLVAVRTASGLEVQATPEHPFYVVGSGWVSAGELALGDRVVTGAQSIGSAQTVIDVRLISGRVQVHNLEVAELHTYLAVCHGKAMKFHP
jgi:hypothetical protein